MSDHPVTRWEQADHSGYGRLFAQLVADGTDVDSEARLADVLVPRCATVLDAGSGMGRVADGVWVLSARTRPAAPGSTA